MRASPEFLFGLTIRIILVVAAMPWTHENWFIPFLTHLRTAGSIDVWADFLAAGGNPGAFPYGAIYILAFAPLTLLGDALGGAFGAHIGLGITVVLLDMAMLRTLQMIAPDALRRHLVWLYWLSPITLYVGYWHGHLDILPTLLLTLSLLGLKTGRLDHSAMFLALAIAAKISMVIAAPFIFVHLYGSPRARSSLLRYICITALVTIAAFGPLLLFGGFREMALGTPELQKSIALAVDYGGGLTLYVLPMVYAALLFIAWRVRRISFEELVSFIALVFLALYLLTPAAPGWAMWFTAFVALHTARSGLRAGFLYLLLCLSFVALHLLISAGVRLNLAPYWDLTHLAVPAKWVPIGELPGWTFSLFTVAALAIATQMVRERILDSNFHMFTRKPLLIGIAGDSGTGKDTLSSLIGDMFGQGATCLISGDDYHTWDRHKPMWRALTHLNPNANDLERFAVDVLRLRQRRSVRAPHYDHHIGRMTKPLKIKPREVIIVSGLHAIYSADLNARYDLRIFLDMHEGLRRYLKVRRDVSVRGHAKESVLRSIEARANDSDTFIKPQKSQADVIVSLEPVQETDIEDFDRPIESISLRLRLRAKHDGCLKRLEILLVSMGGLHVTSRTAEDGFTEMLIEGVPSTQQVGAMASQLSPELQEHLSRRPKWHDAQNGLLQLIALSQIDRIRAAAGGVI